MARVVSLVEKGPDRVDAVLENGDTLRLPASLTNQIIGALSLGNEIRGVDLGELRPDELTIVVEHLNAFVHRTISQMPAPPAAKQKRARIRADAPPRWAECLLYLLLEKRARDHLPGDLEEEFRTVMRPKFGERYARRWYCFQVLRSLWPLLRNASVKWLGLGFAAEWIVRKIGI
jgi:hypothetical protein